MASTNNETKVGFVGFVTRKDKDMGVTLRAKIVTPNKKLAAYKDVRVKVKANALDDYSCCVIDHATVKKIIENTQDLDSLSESFQFLYSGEHGTTIEYKIIGNGEDESIKDYLSDDGTLVGRPRYSEDGAADVTGLILVSVKKNDAKVESRIMVTIKGLSAEEVLNSEKVYIDTKSSLDEYLWDIIKGNNDSYSGDGYKHIFAPLNFKQSNEIFAPKLSTTPIKCEWSVELDEVGTFMKSAGSSFSPGLYLLDTQAGSRICMDKTSNEYGNVYRPSYKSTVTEIHRKNGSFTEIYKPSTGNTGTDRKFRIGNPSENASTGRLLLRATLSLGDAQISRDFWCATMSLSMTNTELGEFIEDILQVRLDMDSNGFGGKTYSLMDSDTIDIVIPNMNDAATAAAAPERTIAFPGNGFYSSITSAQRRILELGEDTLNSIVRFETNETPKVYKTEEVGNVIRVDSSGAEYQCTTLFSNSNFDTFDVTVDGRQINDMYRTLTIPKGNASTFTGLYRANKILNEDIEYRSFAVCFTIHIPQLSDLDEGPYTIRVEKIFKLTRQ